jgi:hypothetical protein
MTGVPYQVTNSKSESFFGHVKVEDDLEEFLEDQGLELHYTHCEQTKAEQVVGEKIYDSYDYPAIIEVDIDLLQREINAVTGKFEKFGIAVKPRLFLVHSVS